MRRSILLLPVILLATCGGAPARPAASPILTISVVGTNDLHGHVTELPLLGGYVANLRRARAADGGGVLLLDAGDMFQGTLESTEGACVVATYDTLGYDAAAAGNHDFDFGRATLLAHARDAKFKILGANVVDEATGRPILATRAIVDVAGVRVGVTGVTTIDTPRSTVNFDGLAIRPLAQTLDDEVRALRQGRAEIVVVIAHAGMCVGVTDTDKVVQCEEGEILDVVRAMKEPVDVVVAGHTHAGVVRRERGVAITEGWSFGRGFGRVDVRFDRARRQVVDKELFLPRRLQAGDTYEGAPVVVDERVSAVIAPFLAGAARRRDQPIGVRVETQIENGYDRESPIGNLVVDLIRKARPADVAIGNGGSLRRPLPPGELTYGTMYATYPFDNRFATMRVTGADLRRVVTGNLQGKKGILTISGLSVVAACKGAALDVRLLRPDGREVKDSDKLTLVTSDFLIGNGMEGSVASLPAEDVKIDAASSIRDEVVELLRQRGGVLRGDDPTIAPRRLSYPGRRPVVCP